MILNGSEILTSLSGRFIPGNPCAEDWGLGPAPSWVGGLGPAPSWAGGLGPAPSWAGGWCPHRPGRVWRKDILFNQMFSARQPRQGVKVAQRFRDRLRPHLQDATDGLVKPKLIDMCPTISRSHRGLNPETFSKKQVALPTALYRHPK